jgi:hypothetical protein
MELENIQEQYRRLQLQEQLMIQRAYESGDVDAIMKAESYVHKAKRTQNSVKSIILDPFSSKVNYGWIEKNSNLSYSVLRGMSLTPIPRAIINTRKEQVAEFCRPQEDEYSTGFMIRKKKKHFLSDKENKLSKAEQQEIEDLTNWMINCGNINNKWHGDDFESFVRKFIEDCLSLDQGTFEVVRGRNSSMENIVEFLATDGSTYRIADSYDEDEAKKDKKDVMINGYLPSYVQLIEGRIVSEFYPWELCFGVRNPQTNIKSSQYGRSELEDLINTVTDLLNASSYNSNYFRIGSNPKGILKVKNLNTTRIEEFRQNWLSEMAGVQNSHKMPIIDADQLEFISTQQSNKDMEYGKYLEFLIKISCAIYKISPEEIGFPLEGMNASSLSQGDNKSELEYSRNKGLAPLLRFLQNKINKMLIGPLTNDKYEFIFTGFDKKTEMAELESDIKKVTNGGMSVQDIFKKYSGRDIDLDKDIILNPIFLQYKQMMAMGNPESNQYIEDEFEDEEDDNPFVSKAVSFLDEELNHKK